MYLSQKWLSDFVKIPKSVSPEELGLRLTMHTVEIDSVESQAEKFDDVVVGKILEVSSHPNADKLRKARVDVGSEELDIVCGAPNIEAGQLVPVAKVGAVLPGDFTIRESEIRGEKSCGMLCAEDELGLGEDHDGILILDKKAKVGQNLAEYLKLDDVLYEVDNKSITNRPDLWGHYGMGREVAAFLGEKFKEYKQIKLDDIKVEGEVKELKVSVKDAEACPRYMGVTMEGIKVKESPKWMQERLIAVGVRPISNIVDITNYVMFEFGQPMHAFDRRSVDEIVVRNAQDGEEIKTLDGETRKLDAETLVIADSAKVIAIAGIMGGSNSEVSNDTTSIILESANFNFVKTRKASQKLGIRTEASVRFEKSQDPNNCETAIVRAIELVKEICPGAKVVSQVIDVRSFDLDLGPIELSVEWLKSYISNDVTEEIILDILNKLGFEVENDNGNLKVAIPTWRATKDVSIKEDLAEEVSRIYGYNKLSPVMPRVEMKALTVNEDRKLERNIKVILAGGPSLNEVYNYSFVGEEYLDKFGIDYFNYVRLVNPIATHQTMLRQSLIPNILHNVKLNQARYDEFGFFEIGNIYLSVLGEVAKGKEGDARLPFQEKKVAVVLVGSLKIDLFKKIKGNVGHLCSKLNLDVMFDVTEVKPAWADESVLASVIIEGKVVGYIYKLSKQVSQKLGIKKEVLTAELSLRELMPLAQRASSVAYRPFEKFPPMVRDLAFVVNEKVLYNDIRNEIVDFNELISDVELFDEYSGEGMPEGKKSLAFHIVYQANKTLKAEEIDVVQKALARKLEERFEAKLRDF